MGDLIVLVERQVSRGYRDAKGCRLEGSTQEGFSKMYNGCKDAVFQDRIMYNITSEDFWGRLELLPPHEFVNQLETVDGILEQLGYTHLVLSEYEVELITSPKEEQWVDFDGVHLVRRGSFDTRRFVQKEGEKTQWVYKPARSLQDLVKHVKRESDSYDLPFLGCATSVEMYTSHPELRIHINVQEMSKRGWGNLLASCAEYLFEKATRKKRMQRPGRGLYVEMQFDLLNPCNSKEANERFNNLRRVLEINTKNTKLLPADAYAERPYHSRFI